MRRESLLPFLPAALAAVTTGVTAAIVRAKQPEYPDSVIVFQIVMFGVALLAAAPKEMGTVRMSWYYFWPGCSSQGFRWGISISRRSLLSCG